MLILFHLWRKYVFDGVVFKGFTRDYEWKMFTYLTFECLMTAIFKLLQPYINYLKHLVIIPSKSFI